jgi:4-amino-4-deoxy-L-arabinose transferase-like glycosyltransferase
MSASPSVAAPPPSLETIPACAPRDASPRLTAAERWDIWQRPVRAPILIILAWCGFLFFFGIVGHELWRTEALRAILAQEMLDSGNWIVPRLYGEPMFTKPPGMYIAIVLCSLPFGQITEWTARLPSALAATLTVLLFYWYMKRRLGTRAGLMAALLLPMAPMWLDKASAAEIDMLQVFWIAASLIFLFRALEEHNSEPVGNQPHKRWLWWLAALLCMTGGVLTKWTAPAFFYATAVTLLWRRGQLRLLISRYHLVSAAVAAAIVLSWIVAAVALEGWDVFLATVSREGLSRVVPNYGGHPYRWWESLYHPVVILVNTLPWSVAALWALRPGFAASWDAAGRRTLQELHCWVWPSVVVWSLVTEHTPRHSFPLFPGIAGLAAMVWIGCFTGRVTWRLRGVPPARFLAAALALWLLAKTMFVFAVMPARVAQRNAREKGAMLAQLVSPGSTVYLFRLKDDGIMFYYGRPALRLPSPRQLPASGEPIYCILTRPEWDSWSLDRPTQLVCEFADEQGDPCVLVRVLPRGAEPAAQASGS